MEVKSYIRRWNYIPTVTPTNWEAFENNRSARFESAVSENTDGYRQFCKRANEMIERGRNKRHK